MRTMISRSVILVLLLFILVATSNFEVRQQLMAEAEAKRIVSRRKQLDLDIEEVVQEKIILSQEKSIHQLSELVRSLQRQLQHCRGINNKTNSNSNPLPEDMSESEDQQLSET